MKLIVTDSKDKERAGSITAQVGFNIGHQTGLFLKFLHCFALKLLTCCHFSRDLVKLPILTPSPLIIISFLNCSSQ